jgi:hypothetical protein
MSSASFSRDVLHSAALSIPSLERVLRRIGRRHLHTYERRGPEDARGVTGVTGEWDRVPTPEGASFLQVHRARAIGLGVLEGRVGFVGLSTDAQRHVSTGLRGALDPRLSRTVSRSAGILAGDPSIP